MRMQASAPPTPGRPPIQSDPKLVRMLIEPNDQQEKQRRIEFIQAVGLYLEKTLSVVQLAPEMLPVVVEGLKFLVRGFRVGREMEDVIEAALDQLQARAQGQGGQPQPQHQAEQMKAQ